MYDFIKKYKVPIIVFVILFVFLIGWILFGNIHRDRGTADSVRTELDDATREQQQASDTLESVQHGIDDSQSTVNKLGQSNSDAQNTVDRISGSNNSAKKSVENAQRANSESSRLINDSQCRISKSLTVIQNIRSSARTNSK